MSKTERDLTQVLKHKFKKELNDIGARIRYSEESKSVYLYLMRGDKAALIRVSDHYTFINPTRVKYECRKKIGKVCYVFTTNGYKGEDMFYMSETNSLAQKVKEFFDV